jgi:hypothetical protein
MDMDVDASSEPSAWSGATRRALWKRTLIASALDPSLPDSERALYAALAPADATAAVLASSCRTWRDRMWAAVNGAVEAKLGAELGRIGAECWDPAGTEGGAEMDAEGAARERERRREEGERRRRAEEDGAEEDATLDIGHVSEMIEDQAEDGLWEEEWVATLRTFLELKPEEGWVSMNMLLLHYVLPSNRRLTISMITDQAASISCMQHRCISFSTMPGTSSTPSPQS